MTLGVAAATPFLPGMKVVAASNAAGVVCFAALLLLLWRKDTP